MPSGKEKSREDKCEEYPQFMRGLNHRDAHVAFWVLFALVILLMCGVSCSYAMSHDCEANGCRRKCNQASEQHKRTKITCQNRCLFTSIGLTIAATTALAFGACAGLNMQFCHEEDLMVFIWAMWSVIQLGSVLAMWGVVLHQLRARFSNGRPSPWNVALGTGVLVIAGLGHWVWQVIWRWWNGERQEEVVDEHEDLGPPDRGMQFMYSSPPAQTIPPGATLAHDRDGTWTVWVPSDVGNGFINDWIMQQRADTMKSKESGIAVSQANTIKNFEDGV
ncbi:hypothetical protein HYFRA_00003430 [Hymenoscyphus fraxineus]|uniref:Transmembrane protein n=1 Tax=Hymenoscyphus fraxineus TaxID=746836 RepID=A0A9N9PSB9_9HELO|nr:hypothetical protein HYFRA_00003430 [Hymenoscyphus fraxineus]